MKALCKWTIITVMILLIVAVLTGCDNRSRHAPDISVNISDSSIYNEASGDSIRNSSIIRISLSGNDAIIENQKIWFIYERSVGNLYPVTGVQGDKVYARTSETGYVEVIYNADPDKAGLESFRIYAQDYANSSEEFHIMVYDIPEISLESTTSIVPISSPAETLYVTVVLNSLSANFDNETVYLALREQHSGMTLLTDSVVTNEHGRASFEVVAGPYAGLWGVIGTMKTFNFKTDEVEFEHEFPE